MDSSQTRSLDAGASEALSRVNDVAMLVPTISEQDGVLALHFQSGYVQSQMLVADPDALALTYSRTMVAFELFKASAERVGIIGLGGGSIAKWCYRHHPQAHITVVEVNSHVIALRDRFSIPPDDFRFHVICDDGAKYIGQQVSRFDVLLVDVFGIDRLPTELRTLQFYEDCFRSLSESGLLVVNLCGKNHRMTLRRIRKCFSDRVLLSPDADGNTVVFACKGELLWHEHKASASLQKKLKRFEKRHGLRKAMMPIS